MKLLEDRAQKIERILSSRHLYLQIGKTLEKELKKAVVMKRSPIKMFQAVVNFHKTPTLTSLYLEKYDYQKREGKIIENTRRCCHAQSFRFNYLEKLLLETQFHAHKCHHLKCLSFHKLLQILTDHMQKHQHPYHLFTAKQIKTRKLV
jgi:hypothetical protein